MSKNIYRIPNVKFPQGYQIMCLCVAVTGEKCGVNGWSAEHSSLSGSTMIRTERRRNKTEHRHVLYK